MSSLKIQGKEYVISKVFSGDEFAFRIPEYQRPYSWQEEQADELLSDFLASIDSKQAVSTNELTPYFLGSIVLIKKEGQAESIVVDGQQRLTTLTILLAALREIGNDDSITPFLYQEKQKHVIGSMDRYRLLLREEDQEFFCKYIQARGGFKSLLSLDPAKLSDSQKCIVNNGKYFCRGLEKLSLEQRDNLVRFILNQCVVIVVTSLDTDSAFRIFSILNDRGLDLSHTDILKAEIIGKISSEKQKQYSQKWVNLENDLGRKLFEELFAHIRMIYRRSKMRESILKEFREYVAKAKSPEEIVDDILIPYGQGLGEIENKDFESTKNAEKVNSLFGWLKLIDNVDWIPPALFFLTQNRNDPDSLVKFLQRLERLASSMFIRRVNITSRIERYGNVLKAISDGQDLYAPASALQLSSKEKEETVSGLQGNIYELPRVPLFVLLRLNHAFGDGEVEFKYEVISIEHVLPQNPKSTSEWCRQFPREKERAELTHKLGNLVLLSRRKNASAGNLDFKDKKTKYFSKDGICSFPLTVQVLKESDWNPQVIFNRQTVFIGKLKEVWDLG
jgi:uncharacterized protein with ParB-like and HNH nuclease domain